MEGAANPPRLFHSRAERARWAGDVLGLGLVERAAVRAGQLLAGKRAGERLGRGGLRVGAAVGRTLWATAGQAGRVKAAIAGNGQALVNAWGFRRLVDAERSTRQEQRRDYDNSP